MAKGRKVMSKDNIGWTKLGCTGFTTREKAQRFINVMGDQHFGAREITPAPNSKFEFRIVEKEGEFYIHYKMLEKPAL